MSSYIPRKPVGFDQESMFHMAVWDRLFGPEGQIHGSPNVKVSKTTKGIFIDVDPGRGGKNSPSSSSNQHCKITAISDLYLSVVTYYKDSNGTGHAGTETIKAAKQLPQRIAWITTGTTETLLGVTYTYTVVSGQDTNNYRHSTDDATPTHNTQIEEVYRPYQVGDEVDIIKVDHTGVFIGTVSVVITVTDGVPSMTADGSAVTLTPAGSDYTGTIGSIAIVVTVTDGVPTITADGSAVTLTQSDTNYTCVIGGTELTQKEDNARVWARTYAQ